MILSGPSLLFVLVPQLVEVVFFSIVIQNFKRCSQQNHTFTYLINNNKMNVINNYKKILDLYISIFLYSSCKNQPFCSSGGGFLLVKKGLFDLLSVSMTSASVSLGVWAPVSGSMSVMSSPDWVIENSANL